MELDGRQTLIIAIVVLYLGKALTHRVAFLRAYNIPEAVSGGVLVSVGFSVLHAFGLTATFDLDLRDELLVVFFTTIGLSANLKSLVEGGRALAILLVLTIFYLWLQNSLGVAMAAAAGLEPAVGLLAGSVSLSGGHGTTIAWSPVFRDELGIANALELGIASATFGLVLGGLIGGPIAQLLIRRYRLEPPPDTESLKVGLKGDEREADINVGNMLSTILVIAIAIGLGGRLHELVHGLGIKLPFFVSCLFGGIVLTNTVPFVFKKMRWPAGSNSMALVADLSLGLFLAMSLMSLQLWTLVDAAGFLLVMLAAQLVLISLFVFFVVFRAMGRNYDAAVMCSGFAGLGLGATPTAIANMTAVTKQFGSSPKAFIVIPLIGAFFVDISNATIIQRFIEMVS